MARKFESEYRVSKVAEVLKSENAFRLSVDLRCDQLETDLAALGSSASELVARVLRVIETEISPRAAEIEALLTDYRQGVPAASVQEEPAGRQFMTPDRRAALLTELRGGVAPAYQTLQALVDLIATKASPADITAAIDALKGGVSTAYDTLVEIAAKLTADDTALAGLLTSVGNRLRLDADQGNSAAQKLQGLQNLGIQSLSKGVFAKADRTSVAFTRTANGAVSLKAGTVIELAGILYTFSADTAVQMPALVAGTDYAVYLCNDGALRADASFTAATGFTATSSRQIGGFHYAPGGNAAARAGGDATPQINPYSLWDIKFRPACADPRGMTLVAGSFWSDIYLTGVDHHLNGTSKYNVAIADGSSPPKIPASFGGNGSTTYSTFNWWEAEEVMQDHGKDLMSYGEFAAAAFGSTELSPSGTDPGSTILRQAYTSKWGLMLATGNMWVWSRDFSYRTGANAEGWKDVGTGRGSLYLMNDIGLVAAIFGGNWGELAADCGSRASSWGSYPWSSLGGIGARGRCDHLHHV